MAGFSEIKYANQRVQDACNTLKPTIEGKTIIKIVVFVVVIFKQKVGESTHYLANILVDADKKACVHVKLEIPNGFPAMAPVWINQGDFTIQNELADL